MGHGKSIKLMKQKYDQLVALWPNGTLSVVHGTINQEEHPYSMRGNTLFWHLDAEGDPAGALLIAPGQHVGIAPGTPTVISQQDESGNPISFILYEGVGGDWRKATEQEVAKFFSDNVKEWKLEDSSTWEDEDDEDVVSQPV
jgi:hypothetical protein